MSSLSPNTVILQSLYRSLLKQSRIIDQSPIHQCFLVSKPRKIYVHEYGQSVNVRLYNADFEIVERILNEHCGGEYFCPSYPNQESKSLQNIIKHIFRFGIPSKYDLSKILDPSSNGNNTFNKYLELSFYAKKRLSHSTNVINKIPKSQQSLFLNFPPIKVSNDYLDKLGLSKPFSISSLTPLNIEKCEENKSETSSSSDLLCNIGKGSLLISHPLACLGQPDLYRKVILIIEQSADRIVGITLNSAHSLFDDNAPKSISKRSRSKHRNVSTHNQSEFEYCFRGWRGEYNYIGGPVNDQNCPFCIMHSNVVFFEKFKECSIKITNDTFWTWVTADNYTLIYHALNRITQIMQFKENQSTESEEEKEEISGKEDEIISDAEIVGQSEEKKEKKNDILGDEYFESIMNDAECQNSFKFFQKYSYWAPQQLEVEIKNNVWFAAELSDEEQMRGLLKLKCPSLTSSKKKRGDDKKQFNKWMWQAFVEELGNEFGHLSVFPDLNNEQTKEFYAFMEEFHSSWIPDVEAEESYISDDDEEEDTVW